MDKNQANDYINRINRALDYIDRNLADDIMLAQISSVAGFSEFQFHRIFSAMTGETLFSFIWRLRLDRAAGLLCSCDKTVTLIAHSLGFSSSAVFCRKFRSHFSMSPTQYRKSNQSQTNRSISQLLRNDGKAASLNPGYDEHSPEGKNLRRFAMETKVTIEKLSDIRVAYLRYVGPYFGDDKLFMDLYSRLGAWAGPRGIDLSTTFIIYHDDPNVTDEQKLRLSVCVPISDDIKVSGEIGEMTIKGDSYAVGSFCLATNEYGLAWDYMCGQWLPQSGYSPSDSVPFERYSQGGCDEDGKMKVDICIPVEVK